MTGVPVIREASFPTDNDRVAPLLGDYLRQTEAEKAERGLVRRSAELPDRYLRELTAPEDSLRGARILLARADEEDCGIVVISPTDDGRSSEIKRFWTTPAARGRGVGSALLAEALAHATHPVRLSVWDWRDAAIRLYRNHGFSEVPSWDDRTRLLCLERP